MPSNLDARDDLRIEATARWAFQLSYFLLADRRDARSVLYQAAARLYVTTLAQKKRQAKRPKGDVHKKLSLTPGPLLQYLIYLCAEPYEDAQEREHQAGAIALRSEDMIVRYIKHLTMLYLERNSFYAAVGQSCVLFDFGTGQAGRLYETLVQGSPAHLDTKGDYSVRDAKRELRRRLARRFGRFLTIYDGARGEQLFVRMNDAGNYFQLVKLCLHRLRPVQKASDPAGDWHLPARFDVAAYDLAELQHDERNRDPSAEHAAELRRMHVVTHPCCWARLLRALRFNYSRWHMVLPEFNLTKNQNTDRRPPYDRRNPPELTPAELEGLTEMLRSEARRRKGLFSSQLSVTIDGMPRASWSIDRDRIIKIGVEADARVLAISTHDEEGDLLLAQYLLQYGRASRSDEAAQAAVTLEGGQEFTFTVTPGPHEADDGLVVTIRFREMKLHRAALRHLTERFGRFAVVPHALPYIAKLKTATIVCVAVLAVLLAGWWVARTLLRNPQPPQVVNNETDKMPPGTPAKPESAPSSGPVARMSPGAGDASDEVQGNAAGDKRGRPSSARAASNANRAATKSGGNEAVNAAPPAAMTLNLEDGARVVRVDRQGRFAGLEGLPREWRRAIEAALLAGRVNKPAILEGLSRETETLLGDSAKAVGANIIGPLGVVVESDRPLFRWRAAGVEARYIVSVFDSRFKRVAQSNPLSATEWTPPQPLQRGNTYVWKITTLRGGEEIVSPAPPAPEARFRVLDQTAANELERARRLHPNSHLLLGVLYARAGLMDEAERELRAVVESNPNSSVALNLLRSVQEWRGSR